MTTEVEEKRRRILCLDAPHAILEIKWRKQSKKSEKAMFERSLRKQSEKPFQHENIRIIFKQVLISHCILTIFTYFRLIVKKQTKNITDELGRGWPDQPTDARTHLLTQL